MRLVRLRVNMGAFSIPVLHVLNEAKETYCGMMYSPSDLLYDASSESWKDLCTHCIDAWVNG